MAASLLPISAEIYLAHLMLSGDYLLWLLWLAATLGNVAGSFLDWWMGVYCLHWQHKKWFPFSSQQLERAQQVFQQHGQWVLVFAWLPIVGDPLCFAAGVLRVPWLPFLLWVSLSKGLRYALFMWGLSWF